MTGIIFSLRLIDQRLRECLILAFDHDLFGHYRYEVIRNGNPITHSVIALETLLRDVSSLVARYAADGWHLDAVHDPGALFPAFAVPSNKQSRAAILENNLSNALNVVAAADRLFQRSSHARRKQDPQLDLPLCEVSDCLEQKRSLIRMLADRIFADEPLIRNAVRTAASTPVSISASNVVQFTPRSSEGNLDVPLSRIAARDIDLHQDVLRLCRAGVDTVGQLLALTIDQLKDVYHFNDRSIAAFNRLLGSYGLRLGVQPVRPNRHAC